MHSNVLKVKVSYEKEFNLFYSNAALSFFAIGGA